MKLSEFKPTEEVLERVRKCTTPDELVTLAQEYDVELTPEEISDILKSNSLKELNDTQLNQVAGGDYWVELKSKHLPKDHGRHIGKYEAEGHIGERVYCVDDNKTDDFAWGILMGSREMDMPIGTQRVHDIRIEGWCNDLAGLNAFNKTVCANKIHIPVGEVLYDIKGDDCTLFLYR